MIVPGDLVRGDSVETCWLFVKPDSSSVPYPERLLSTDIGVIIGKPGADSVWLVVYTHGKIAYILPERVVTVSQRRKQK